MFAVGTDKNIDSKTLGIVVRYHDISYEVFSITRERYIKNEGQCFDARIVEKTPDHLFDAAVHGKVDAVDGG